MSDAKSQNEPSMEEILASIRRIIAEDGDTAPAEGAPPAPAAAPAAQRSDDVLELTEVVDDSGSVVNLSQAAAEKAAMAEPPARPDAFPPPSFEREPVPEREPTPSVDEDDRLVSAATAAASVSAMSQLTGGRLSGDMPLGAAGRTLEELVRELLRPMLRQWLDAHLPSLVERLVQEEIARMGREAQGR